MTASPALRLLAFSPYHGGSHAQFLEEWVSRSRHEWSCATLPARHFKWRIRQASYGLASAAHNYHAQGRVFDAIWTTSMVDVAELRGLLPMPYRNLPLISYFHENQLVYPVRKEEKRNQHFSLINWVSALASDEVWFNSQFNLDSMLSGLGTLLRKMPDEKSLETLEVIRRKSRVEPLGVAPLSPGAKSAGPLHIGWVSRWEHDKRPDLFLRALETLEKRGVPFVLSLFGQSFQKVPEEFSKIMTLFGDRVRHMGFEPDRAEYAKRLGACDVVVSTADHEFFGVALIEALFCQAVPLVPRRLVYPELYPEFCLYDDDESLVSRLESWSEEKLAHGSLLHLAMQPELRALLERCDFRRRASELDSALSAARDRYLAEVSGKPCQKEDEQK